MSRYPANVVPEKWALNCCNFKRITDFFSCGVGFVVWLPFPFKYFQIINEKIMLLLWPPSIRYGKMESLNKK